MSELAYTMSLAPRAELIPRLSLQVHANADNSKVLVEYAPITEGENQRYHIGTFAPAPERVLQNLGRMLHKEMPLKLPALLGTKPDEVLFYGPEATGNANLLLVAPASVRFSQFSSKSLCGVDDADLPMPKCILQVRGGRLNLFALRSGELVTDATPLLIPPCLNVAVNGSVCLGSMIKPRGEQYRTVEELAEKWWDMFFLSKGSHEHGAGIQVLKDGRSLKELYQGFIKEKTKVFPDELLLEVPKTAHYKTVGDLRNELIKLATV